MENRREGIPGSISGRFPGRMSRLRRHVFIKVATMHTRPLDAFTDLSDWMAVTSGQAKLAITSEPGPHGQAMRLDFDFGGGGGFVAPANPAPSPCRRPLPSTSPCAARPPRTSSNSNSSIRPVSTSGVIWTPPSISPRTGARCASRAARSTSPGVRRGAGHRRHRRHRVRRGRRPRRPGHALDRRPAPGGPHGVRTAPAAGLGRAAGPRARVRHGRPSGYQLAQRPAPAARGWRSISGRCANTAASSCTGRPRPGNGVSRCMVRIAAASGAPCTRRRARPGSAVISTCLTARRAICGSRWTGPAPRTAPASSPSRCSPSISRAPSTPFSITWPVTARAGATPGGCTASRPTGRPWTSPMARYRRCSTRRACWRSTAAVFLWSPFCTGTAFCSPGPTPPLPRPWRGIACRCHPPCGSAATCG